LLPGRARDLGLAVLALVAFYLVFGGLARVLDVVQDRLAGRTVWMTAGRGLLAASVPLFLVAAGIESFVRQSTLSTPARFGVAATAVAVLLGYVALVVVLRRRTLAPNLGWLGAPQASEPQGQPIAKRGARRLKGRPLEFRSSQAVYLP